MVDVAGHLAMALLFAAPGWLLWERRGAVAFAGLTLTTAMVPDVDLYLRYVLPVVHHGVTHTVLFVVVVSAVAGPAAGRWLAGPLGRNPLVRSTNLTGRTVRAFTTGGFLLGGLSHIFADMLSAPDIAAPLSPLWPVYDHTVGVDLLYYDSPWWNFGLFAVAVAVHLALARLDRTPFATRYGFR